MAVSKGTAKAVEISMALHAGRVKTVYNPDVYKRQDVDYLME